MKTYKTSRGFSGFNKWKSVWHGEMRVQESSAAFKGACAWVFVDMANLDEAARDKAPNFHLSCVDAQRLRDGLSKILKLSEKTNTKDDLRGWSKWKSVWHGQIRVRESVNDRLVYVSGDLSYSNEPEENPPHLRLSRVDAKNLRDGLTRFLKEARGDKLVEPARKTQPEAGWRTK